MSKMAEINEKDGFEVFLQIMFNQNVLDMNIIILFLLLLFVFYLFFTYLSFKSLIQQKFSSCFTFSLISKP